MNDYFFSWLTQVRCPYKQRKKTEETSKILKSETVSVLTLYLISQNSLLYKNLPKQYLSKQRSLLSEKNTTKHVLCHI